METNHQRLFLVSGKGGVGKTTFAMALTLKLKQEGKEVYYNSFLQSFTNSEEDLLLKSLSIPHISISTEECAEEYISRKLNSKVIASWVLKTKFFKALFQIIPSLGSMILLGYLIDFLEKNPRAILVIDCPASGHALTIFESSGNFKKIFKNGKIVNDIENMQQFLNNAENSRSIILANAMELSVTEGIELKNNLDFILPNLKSTSLLLINDSFLKYFRSNNLDSTSSDLPIFIKQKLIEEKKLENEYLLIPHFNQVNSQKIISNLTHIIGEYL